MSATVSTELKAEPNLTPLLDIVFQLITFFMLVINFSQDNYDVRIKLPVAGSARPVDVEAGAGDEKLILNINNKGELLFSGKTLSLGQAIEQIKFEAQLFKLNSKAVGGKAVDPNEGLPIRVVIRADRDTPYSPVYSIITACQANGFRKFDLKAMTSE